MPQTVLVTGARGQLAGAIVDEYKNDARVCAYAREELDITDFDAVMKRVAADRPDLIINCASYNNVDQAEDEPERALTVNAFSLRVLARAADAAGATLVHYGTDFVFDGCSTHPYAEEDVPNPQGIYAQSKLLGEWFALEAQRAFVLRVESLFGGAAAKSSVDRIAQAIAAAARRRSSWIAPCLPVTSSTSRPRPGPSSSVGSPGSTTASAPGSPRGTSWRRKSRAIMRKEREAQIVPVSVADVSLKAPRPQFAALKNDKLMKITEMPTWQDALRRYLT